jgi:hypothetical protein
MNFTIKELSSLESVNVWNEFVFAQMLPHYSIGHNPCLPQILKTLFKFEPVYCMIYQEEKLVGVFQAIKDKGKIVSLPVVSTSGLCLAPNYNAVEVYKVICAHFNAPFEIRDFVKFSDFSFDKKSTSYLPLKKDADEQLRSFKSKLRNQIKKGYTNGLQVKIGGLELLKDFYEIYIKNMHRLGVPHPSMEYFKSFVENYKNGQSKIFLITYNNIPVGSCIIFTYGKLSELFWASTVREYNHLNSNMVLYWEVIKYSNEQGFETLSFGRSDGESSSLKFKEQWGIDIYPLSFNYSTAKSNLREFGLINKIWKIIPFPIVKIVGPIIRSKVTS